MARDLTEPYGRTSSWKSCISDQGQLRHRPGHRLDFAREGAKVVVADVIVDGGEETVRLIKTAGGEVLFVKTDVSKSAD